MIPEQATRKALEGGWMRSIIDNGWYWRNTGYIFWYFHGFNGAAERIKITWQEIACSPFFWQALGKSLGWNELEPTFPFGIPKWRNEASVFHDLILTGGDTDKFWDELLAAK